VILPMLSFLHASAAIPILAVSRYLSCFWCMICRPFSRTHSLLHLGGGRESIWPKTSVPVDDLTVSWRGSILCCARGYIGRHRVHPDPVSARMIRASGSISKPARREARIYNVTQEPDKIIGHKKSKHWDGFVWRGSCDIARLWAHKVAKVTTDGTIPPGRFRLAQLWRLCALAILQRSHRTKQSRCMRR